MEKYTRVGLLALLLISPVAQLRSMAEPQSDSEQDLFRSLADSSWDGAMGDVAKGNSPAQLRIILEKGKLTGLLTYDGFEETLSVTLSPPSAVRFKGVSYRDLQGEHRTFDLDTLNAEISLYGKRLSGRTDTRSRFEFRRIK